MTAPARHARTTVWLHWLSALLVAALWGGAHLIDLFDKGAPRWNARGVHMTLGVLLGVLLVWRLLRRWRGSVAVRSEVAGAQLARLMHAALYGLLGLTVLLGLTNAWVRGEHVFTLFAITPFDPANPALRRLCGALHEWAANVLLVLAGLHGAAALWHHYFMRDDVLVRMAPWLARR